VLDMRIETSHDLAGISLHLFGFSVLLGCIPLTSLMVS